jgi:hypothetical protein
MINYYQPSVWPFLQLKANESPHSTKFYYYHSFEDGLWDFIKNKFSSAKKITLLVPDFYCSDVLDNLKLHGFRYIYYPLDADFQISPSQFRKYLWLYKPEIVVIFNACGITSNLFSDTGWLLDLPKDSWILEDNVHRLSDPEKITLLTDHHVVMDSLRKVSSLPGSRLFGSNRALDFIQNKSSYFSRYFLSSFFYYQLFQIFFFTGCLFNSSRLVIWAHDYWLSLHDDIIGDSFIPQPGFSFFIPFINRINYKKISKLKITQVKIYNRLLKNLFTSKHFYRISIPAKDFGALHVYPLGFKGPPDLALEKYLEQNHAPVWFKFTDTPWSRTRGVLFLPLGFHMHLGSICHLVNTLSAWSKLS